MQTRMIKGSILRLFQSTGLRISAVVGAIGCSSPVDPGVETTADGQADTAADLSFPADVGKGDTVAVDAKPDGSSVPDSAAEPSVTENFWVLYNRVSAFSDQASKNDYVLAGWKNPAAGVGAGPSIFGAGVHPEDPKKSAIFLTKVAFVKTAMSCQYGCFMSPDLKWMAVAKAPADAKGHYTYGLGSVSPDLVAVGLDKDNGLKDIKHLEFAGKYLFYSQKANCLGTGACQYDVHRRGPLGEATLTDDVLTRMAPDNDPDVLEADTTYNGYFRVSADGSTVVFQTPTIRSQKVYVWHAGNVAKLDYICPNWDGAKCVGTGSQYNDNDPVAVSMDGKRVVTFSIVDRWLRARRYDVGTENPSTFSNLLEVPAGKKYSKQAGGAPCSVVGPEGHTQVRYNPEFSLDGKRVWFVGYSNCAGASDKVWTDVMSIEADRIGSELGVGDIVNWTRNPRDNSAKNKVIQGFAMSPGRQVILLAATSTISGSGQLIADTDMRAKNDTELYTLAAGGTKMVPITNENGWLTQGPTATLPMAP